ncbi:nitrate- and nitrite sensing domain-containing protein [Streptomyces sp. NPDC006172]|uniref:sensor histidine kinase n=1 Tax=Streptomyces sp. NPDC006172 TaxID=3154470 RepID=UPI0033DE2698
MQKTRPRRTGRQTASEQGAERTPVGKGRPAHVRNRLIVAVAVVAAAIAGAGAPSVVAASGQLNDSQNLVTLAERTQDALVLAQSLADERDEVTTYVAAGRTKGKAPSGESSARVDRQVGELTADTDTPAALRTDLGGIAAVRQAALTGRSTALEAHRAYSAAITELHALAEQLAQQMPPRAGAGAYALADLDTAVQQATAARGLLLAALNVPTSTEDVTDPVTGRSETRAVSSDADTKQRDELTAAAQQARLRSDAALASFRDSAPEEAVDAYDSTVTGGDVTAAQKYLTALTDQPALSDDELGADTKKVDAALTGRVALMRGAESSAYDRRVKDLAQLRDDDVTALELRVALLGALILVAVGISTAMARSLTRPLAVLRIGSSRLAGAENPAAEEPVRFTGRDDEFAQVVRSVNALHEHAVALHERIATLESDRKHLVGQRQKMADAREELRTELADAAERLGRLRTSISGTFVNLSLRTLGLVERQLAVIEGLEEREHDPERLATLFKLDHFATVMRRHSENLLVLAGEEHVQQHAGPIPLVDVVRAAVSEIERYERVRISALPPHAHVAGFAADDLSHLLAELMENATSFSPPDLPVEVSGWLLENGEVMLSVQDEGIGMTGDRLTRLNSRLTDFDPDTPYDQEGEDGLGLGLYVVARLAHRHGVRVQLREQKQGGVAAVVVLPAPLLASPPAASVPATPPTTAATSAVTLPGADAESNGNILPARAKPMSLPETPAETTMELLLPLSADPSDPADTGDAADDVGTPAGTADLSPAEDTAGTAAPAGTSDSRGDADTSATEATAAPAGTQGSADTPGTTATSGTEDTPTAATPADAAGFPGMPYAASSADADDTPATATPADADSVPPAAGPGDTADSRTARRAADDWPSAAPTTDGDTPNAAAPTGTGDMPNAAGPRRVADDWPGSDVAAADAMQADDQTAPGGTPDADAPMPAGGTPTTPHTVRSPRARRMADDWPSTAPAADGGTQGATTPATDGVTPDAPPAAAGTPTAARSPRARSAADDWPSTATDGGTPPTAPSPRARRAADDWPTAAPATAGGAQDATAPGTGGGTPDASAPAADGGTPPTARSPRARRAADDWPTAAPAVDRGTPDATAPGTGGGTPDASAPAADGGTPSMARSPRARRAADDWPTAAPAADGGTPDTTAPKTDGGTPPRAPFAPGATPAPASANPAVSPTVAARRARRAADDWPGSDAGAAGTTQAGDRAATPGRRPDADAPASPGRTPDTGTPTSPVRRPGTPASHSRRPDTPASPGRTPTRAPFAPGGTRNPAPAGPGATPTPAPGGTRNPAPAGPGATPTPAPGGTRNPAPAGPGATPTPAPGAPRSPQARRAADDWPGSAPAAVPGSGPTGGHAGCGEAEAEAEHGRAADAPEELVTDKGLPKRTPKLTAPTPTPRRHSGSVDAEALRRRLGGFRSGAQAGYRDVEAELAHQTAPSPAPNAAPDAPQEARAHAEEDTGGTVEEASS